MKVIAISWKRGENWVLTEIDLHKKRVTLKQIASQSGVSSTTVSLVINGRDDIHIARETRERIIKVAGELGYDLNKPRARKQTLPTILFISSDSSNNHIGTSFFSNLFRELKLNGSHLFNFIDIVCDRENLPAQIKFFMKSDPLLIITYSLSMYRALRTHGIKTPVIIPQGDENQVLNDPMASVFMVDDRQVGLLAAQEIRRKGYDQCEMIFPRGESRTIKERQDSFISEFQRIGGVAQVNLFDSFNPAVIKNLIKNMDLSQSKSFFCYSDAIAIYVLGALQKKFGHSYFDYAVIGTDNLYWGEHTIPSLTTMDLKEKDMALRIILEGESLLRGIPFQSSIIRFPVTLIPRESTEHNISQWVSQ
jgi:LacI family transcriptional regulator